MDKKGKFSVKGKPGNLTEDARTEGREENPITGIKVPELRKPDPKADLKEQKDRLKEGRKV